MLERRRARVDAPGKGLRATWSEHWADRRRLFREVLSFLSVGGVAYLVDVGLSNVLLFGFLGVPALLVASPVKAKVVSTIVSMAVAWVGNRFLTYGQRNSGSALAGMWKFIVVNLIGMVIVVAPLGVTWYLLGLHDPVSYNISTNVIGIGLAMIFRFWAYRTWVFPDRSEQDPAAEVVVTDGFDHTSR
ncbi:GtrA family protein [Brevibacterium yomogidense]|uniref:GtrA family protein n=1 Tax=Brevibacterium yomogidense TaxID=946573 RepID=UPI001E5C6562|nr:GtrA family protein [Brevibacterium yomogidense]